MGLRQVHVWLFDTDVDFFKESRKFDFSKKIRQIIHNAVKQDQMCIFKFVAMEAPLPSNPNIIYDKCIALALAHTEDEARKALITHMSVQDPPIDSAWLVEGCAKVVKFPITDTKCLSIFMR